MRQDLTHIVVVMDRSGSMRSRKAAAEEGLRSFLEEQKQQPGDATFTLVQFDDKYEVPVRNQPLRDVEPPRLDPRDGTALWDAVGRAINETGAYLRGLPEAERPGLVCFVTLTDGKDNAHFEDGGPIFTAEEVKAMREHQETVYKWQFQFLGVGMEAFAQGVGVLAAAAASSPVGATRSAQAYGSASANVARMRSATANNQPVCNAYTDTERQSME